MFTSIDGDENTLNIKSVALSDDLKITENTFYARKLDNGDLVMHDSIVLTPLDEIDFENFTKALAIMSLHGYTTLAMSPETAARCYFAGLLVIHKREELRLPQSVDICCSIQIDSGLFWNKIAARP